MSEAASAIGVPSPALAPVLAPTHASTHAPIHAPMTASMPVPVPPSVRNRRAGRHVAQAPNNTENQEDDELQQYYVRRRATHAPDLPVSKRANDVLILNLTLLVLMMTFGVLVFSFYLLYEVNTLKMPNSSIRGVVYAAMVEFDHGQPSVLLASALGAVARRTAVTVLAHRCRCCAPAPPELKSGRTSDISRSSARNAICAPAACTYDGERIHLSRPSSHQMRDNANTSTSNDNDASLLCYAIAAVYLGDGDEALAGDHIDSHHAVSWFDGAARALRAEGHH